ncbi:hypothetical protein FRB94_002881 [Tulasnella sp. JGI-2019a]|nr:hypothetical protein FRB94_002881 [Tulasnella sp. JGI-2019a]
MVSALWKAAGEGDIIKVQELLKDATNVDIELKDHTGVTPLIQAVRNGHVDIVKDLLAHGADPTNSSSQGRPETYTQDKTILDSLRRSAESRPNGIPDGGHQNEISSPAPIQNMHDGSFPRPPQQHQQNGYPTDPAAAAAYDHAMRSGYWYMPPPYAPYGYMPPPPEHMMQGYYGPPPPQMQSQLPPPQQQQQHSPNMSRNPDRQNSNGSSGAGTLPPAEVAKTIPCRYFPMCKYGTDCMFAHPQAPYFNGHQTSPQGPYPPVAYDAHGQPIHYSPPHGYYGMPPTPHQYTQSPNGMSNGPPQPHSPIQHTTSHAPSPHAPPYIPQSEQQQPQQAPPMPSYAYPPPPPQQPNGAVPHVPLSPVAAYHPGAAMPVYPPPPPQPTSPTHHRTFSQSNGYIPQPPMVHAPQLNGLDENHAAKAYDEGGPNGYYNSGGRGDHHGGPRRGGMKKSNGRGPPPPCLFFPAGKCKNGDNCRFPHIRPEDDPDAFPEGFPPTTYPQRARPRQNGGHYSTRSYVPREDITNGSTDPNSHAPRPLMNGNGHGPHMNGFRKHGSPTEQNGHQNGFGGRGGHHHHNGNGTNGFRSEKVNGVANGRNSHSPPRDVGFTPADFPKLGGSAAPALRPTTPNTSNVLGVGGLTAAQVLKGNAAAKAKLLMNGDLKGADEAHLQEVMAKVALDDSAKGLGMMGGNGAETPCPPTPQFPSIATPLPIAAA